MKNELTHINYKDNRYLARLFLFSGYKLALGIALFLFSVTGYTQTMSISTSSGTVAPQAGTVLDLSQNPGSSAGAVSGGFLLPILTTGQMNNISASAPAGLLLFNSTISCYEIYSGSVWNPFWCLCSGTPSITAGASSTSICSGSTINLTATGGASTYSWTGPNGFTSTQQNPSISNATTAMAGTYSVTASNGCGSSPVSIVTITVSPGTAVTAGVVASPVCSGSGSSISLTCSSGGSGATYSWTGPNGFTSSSQNPTISSPTTAASGTYTVNVTEGSCTENSTVAVVVNPTPGTPSNINEIDSLTHHTYVGPCSSSCVAVGQTLEYDVTNVPNTTFTWSVTNGTILSGQGTDSIYVQWTAAGTNEITVYETQNSCPGPTNNILVTVTATCSCTYGCGSSGTFTVPAGIHSVNLSISGAEGGATYIGINNYGTQTEDWGSATYGANLTCKYATSPGTALNCYAGCVGADGTSTAGGAGGAGGPTVGATTDEAGGSGNYWAGAATHTAPTFTKASFVSAAGGGGGGSSVRVGGTSFANIIACAGGGGGDYVRWDWVCYDCQTGNGAGGCSDGGHVGGIEENNDYQTGYMTTGSATGCGGGTTTATVSNGGTDKYGFATADGGGGNTQTAAGGTGAAAEDEITIDETGCTPTVDTHCPGTAGTNGGTPNKGNGGNGGLEGIYSEDDVCEYGPGSGGGGGYYGGGGGCGGGGGGGSSYSGGAGVSSPAYIQCSQPGNGFVTVTW
jgi:hypothetical protein